MVWTGGTTSLVRVIVIVLLTESKPDHEQGHDRSTEAVA